MNQAYLPISGTDSGSIYCEFNDNKQEKTLVLLHGNSSSSRLWNLLKDSDLKAYFNFLVFDLPGHGKSAFATNPEEAYSLNGYSEVLKQCISSIPPSELFAFGHSLGGHILLQSLDQLPELKAAMIMGTPPLTNPPRIELAFQMSPQFISFMQSGNDRDIMKSTFESMVHSENNTIAEILFEDYFAADPQSRQWLAHHIQSGNYRDELQILQGSSVPVYIIAAAQDCMVNHDYFQQFLPDAEVTIIQDAGHYAPLEKPYVFAEFIRQKFAGLSV